MREELVRKIEVIFPIKVVWKRQNLSEIGANLNMKLIQYCAFSPFHTRTKRFNVRLRGNIEFSQLFSRVLRHIKGNSQTRKLKRETKEFPRKQLNIFPVSAIEYHEYSFQCGYVMHAICLIIRCNLYGILLKPLSKHVTC